jgi:hypothetical protein
MPKRQAFWVSDSAGQESLHLNSPGLSFTASQLGHLERVEREWFFVKDTQRLGPYSYAEAKRQGMRACDVEYVG